MGAAGGNSLISKYPSCGTPEYTCCYSVLLYIMQYTRVHVQMAICRHFTPPQQHERCMQAVSTTSTMYVIYYWYILDSATDCCCCCRPNKQTRIWSRTNSSSLPYVLRWVYVGFTCVIPPTPRTVLRASTLKLVSARQRLVFVYICTIHTRKCIMTQIIIAQRKQT